MLLALQNTPLWVWLVLLALLFEGWRQSRSRWVSGRRLILTAVLMLPLSLGAVVSMRGERMELLGLWALGFLLMSAFQWQRNLSDPASDHIRLGVGRGGVSASFDSSKLYPSPLRRQIWIAGSWMPMALFLLVFALRYGIGYAQARHSAWGASSGLLWLAAGLAGGLSGFFLARNLKACHLDKRSAHK